MITNFDFLKNLDHDLYVIAGIAEKLYRDEYFEQCMGQTRRFAENAVKKVLGNRAPYDATFDELINTLKDSSTGNSIEKEFIDDLYFLKKAGNISVHGATVKKDGITALECLRRMFEVAINYAIHVDKTNAALLKLNYDEELLLLGRPKQEQTLKEKYLAAKKILEKQDEQERKARKADKIVPKAENLLPKPLKQKKKTIKKIKTEKISVPEQKTVKKSAKTKTGVEKSKKQSVNITKKSLKNGKLKNKKQNTYNMPLFLNPIAITLSFIIGAVVLVLIASGLKIL